MTTLPQQGESPTRQRIADLPLAEQRQCDRTEYLRFIEAANRLRTLSRVAGSFATSSAEHDPTLHTFAVPVANYIRQRLEQDVAWYAEQAEVAQELAAHYRARLFGEL